MFVWVPRHVLIVLLFHFKFNFACCKSRFGGANSVEAMLDSVAFLHLLLLVSFFSQAC